jgi:hypothetical protein
VQRTWTRGRRPVASSNDCVIGVRMSSVTWARHGSASSAHASCSACHRRPPRVPVSPRSPGTGVPSLQQRPWTDPVPCSSRSTALAPQWFDGGVIVIRSRRWEVTLCPPRPRCRTRRDRCGSRGGRVFGATTVEASDILTPVSRPTDRAPRPPHLTARLDPGMSVRVGRGARRKRTRRRPSANSSACESSSVSAAPRRAWGVGGSGSSSVTVT